MTVRELRQLLFHIDNQEAEVVIATSKDVKYGEVISTKEIVQFSTQEQPEGFITLLTK